MITIEKLLESWPNQAVLAKDLRVPYSTVVKWKARSSIPGAYWKRLVEVAKSRDLNVVTLEAIAAAHARSLDPEECAEASSIHNHHAPVERAGGYFSRFKHVRAAHFATTEQVVDHVRGLRDEWERP